MTVNLGSLTFKEVLEIASLIFLLGGVWRDVRAMRRTVERHGKYLANDRDVLIRIATEHNKNHGACIDVPRINGEAGA